MKEFYHINVAGVERDLPLCKLNDNLQIAAFVIFGDIEANGKIRIEIFNAYGDTVNAPAVDVADISFDEKIAVTFTITGVADAAVDAPADTVVDTQAPTTGDKQSPDTGVEGVAVVAGLAIVAGGAMLLSKKRK